MVIEFDPCKAAANRKKHGVSFAEAEPVLNDPLALTRENGHAEGEIRWVTVGLGAENRVLAVVWTQRGSNIALLDELWFPSNDEIPPNPPFSKGGAA